MTSRHHSPKPLSCHVVVHGNGFLATVRMCDVPASGCRPISFATLTRGDTIGLEIAPVRGDALTVRFGVVQWVYGNEIGVKIILMTADEKRKLDEVATVSGRREARLTRWLRRWLRGDAFHRVHLSYASRVREERARVSEAA